MAVRHGLMRWQSSEHRMAEGVKWRAQRGPRVGMRELFRTNDVVRLSWAQAQLREAGIDSLVLDHHTSLVEGSIGAIPRRLMVAGRDHRRAQSVLAQAEKELP
jgi:hypothetical protein